jgi:small redox-active disulfide protein 2
MHIKILGPGCPNCQKLEANTKQALEELNLEANVEKISEIQDIMSYGIMSTPALIVDEKVIIAGIVPDVKQIKEALINHKESINKPTGGCSCGGNC